MAFQGYSLTLDGATQLKDSYAITADAAGLVNSAAAYYDAGAANAYSKFAIVIDVTALENGSGQYYDFYVECSDTSAFSTTYRVATRSVGNSGSISMPNSTAAGSRIVIFADNVAHNTASADSQVCLRYVRLYTNVNGTLSTGITHTAYLVPIS